MELFATRAGIKVEHVAYKGGAPAQLDAVAGRIPLVMDIHYSTLNHIRAGQLKAIALFSAKRQDYARDIPVVAETVPGVVAVSLVGLVVPSATPRPLVHRISGDIAGAIRNSDLTTKMIGQGMQPVGSTPEEFDALIKTEIAKWAPVVVASGAKVD
jgi:tripartite-type tricarboxylate transporter receptor subunit TctC